MHEKLYFELKNSWLTIPSHSIQEELEISIYFDYRQKIHVFFTDNAKVSNLFKHSAHCYIGLKLHDLKKYSLYLTATKYSLRHWKRQECFEDLNQRLAV